MKRFDITIVVVATALVAGGGGFALGHFTAGAKTVTASASGQDGAGNNAGGGFGNGSGTRGGRFAGGRPTFGTVASISGNTLTITGSDGAAHTVTLTATTTYTNAGATATLADLTTGISVAAFGTAASDGSITATRVIINPTAPGGSGAPNASGTDQGAGSN